MSSDSPAENEQAKEEVKQIQPEVLNGVSSTSSLSCSKMCRVIWISILILLTLLIAILLTIYISDYTFAKDSSSSSYDRLLTMWSLEPIVNIRSDLVGCEEYLTSYQFLGTINGCDCRDVLHEAFDPIIFANECTAGQSQNNCRTIHDTSSQNFSSWRVGDQIFQLCIERSNGFNYLDSDCSNDEYQKCHLGNASDENEDTFCLPASFPCPLRSIIFGNESPDESFQEILQIRGGTFFVSRTTSSATSGQPLAIGAISSGQLVCVDFENQMFIDPQIRPYILLRGIETRCLITDTDREFVKIATIIQEQLFSANNYLDQILRLPDFPLEQGQVYTMNVRAFPKWKNSEECRGIKRDFQDLLEEGQNNGWTIALIAMILSWVVFVAYGLLATALRLLKGWRIKNWWIALAILAGSVMLALIIVIFVISLSNYNRFSEIQRSNCTDQVTNDIIVESSNTTTKLTLTIILLIAIIIAIIISIIYRKTIFTIFNCFCCCCWINSAQAAEDRRKAQEKEEAQAKEEDLERENLMERIRKQDQQLKEANLLQQQLLKIEVIDPTNQAKIGYLNTFLVDNSDIPEELPQITLTKDSRHEISINRGTTNARRDEQVNDLDLRFKRKRPQRQLVVFDNEKDMKYADLLLEDEMMHSGSDKFRSKDGSRASSAIGFDNSNLFITNFQSDQQQPLIRDGGKYPTKSFEISSPIMNQFIGGQEELSSKEKPVDLSLKNKSISKINTGSEEVAKDLFRVQYDLEEASRNSRRTSQDSSRQHQTKKKRKSSFIQSKSFQK